MNNEDFLQMYVKQFNLFHSESTYAAVLDLNYKYIAISSGAATLIKKNKDESLSVQEHIGMSFIDDVARPDWIKLKKVEILSNAKELELPHNYIAITNSEHFLLPGMIICVCPIKNPFTLSIVGFDLSGSEIISRVGKQLEALNLVTDAHSIFRKLTSHELDVLYFKCQMYSDNQVSEVFEMLYRRKISPKTINNILRQQLYPKFNVVSTIALIEKAKSFGIDKLNLLDITNQDTIIELSSTLYLNFSQLISI